VRELKQNASSVIRRVRAGETVEVTDRGVPVALIVPVPEAADVVERLVLEGRAAPPHGNLNDLPPPLPPTRGGLLPSEALVELRADER
jgi:prevent-host-death family protein